MSFNFPANKSLLLFANRCIEIHFKFTVFTSYTGCNRMHSQDVQPPLLQGECVLRDGALLDLSVGVGFVVDLEIDTSSLLEHATIQ